MGEDDRKGGRGMSRRDLLTFWRKPLEEVARAGRSASLASAPSVARKPPLRPPGILHEQLLVASCTRCNKCVEACPAHAIVSLDASWGPAHGTPAIFARTQPCVLCDGMRCSHVCPSGAILPVYVGRDAAMGTAAIDPATCLAHAGQPCDACDRICPLPGAIVREGGKPVVDQDLCVGCGLCEHVCPTATAAVTVTPRE